MCSWCPFLFRSLILSSIAHFLQDFPLEWHFNSFPHSNAYATYADLAEKIGQGHYRVMIYIHMALESSSFVEIGQPVPGKIFERCLPYMGMTAILVA